MSEKEIFEALDLYDNKTFDEIYKLSNFQMLDNFRKIYTKWRKQYVSNKRKIKKLNLDEYSIEVAKRSRHFILPTTIKIAIEMKRENKSLKDITKKTSISAAKLNYMFATAYRHGILDDSNYKVRAGV